jgi:glutamate N-acetyltransferase/amino-acid N-acetyltransferase
MTFYKKAMVPCGFVAGAVCSGIKRTKLDLALFYSLEPALAGVVATRSTVKAAPLIVNQRHRKKAKYFQAIVVNSGNANCFTGTAGLRDAEAMAASAAKGLCCAKENILVASTGVIGRKLPIEKIERAMPQLVASLSRAGIRTAQQAILTTDTFAKTASVTVKIGTRVVTICGVAKGSGMIAPHMATMLGFILTDARITQKALDRALLRAVGQSFNCITVDNCMSTNDTVLVLANGASGNTPVNTGKNFNTFCRALEEVCCALAKSIVRDGEGATKFITINVRRAKNYTEARAVGCAIANSNLFKTAVYGESPNFFGRVVAAVGSSGVGVDPRAIKVTASSLKKKDITIDVSLGAGNARATVYTCDLTHEYIQINTEYN